MIDHSLLHPALTVEELEAGCRLALGYDVASVCILPYYTKRCAEVLAGSSVKTSTTVGFPHGGHKTAIKLAEAKCALDDGAVEIDAVINISKARSEDWAYITHELLELTQLAHSRSGKIKVIFENAYLNDEQKIKLCAICGEINADWVKTSTGFGPGGATFDDLKLMRHYSPSHVQVKAAGGIRDLDTLLAVKEIGVTRVGATRTAQMLEAWRTKISLTPLNVG
jgi:deoxyribose-phosphate aldolase